MWVQTSTKSHECQWNKRWHDYKHHDVEKIIEYYEPIYDKIFETKAEMDKFLT